MINLAKIQKYFNKASRSYDNVAHAQKQAAHILVNMLMSDNDFSPRTILDLGTGTGYIPDMLLPHLKTSEFFLNDIADNMLQFCQEKFAHYSNISYILGDMMQLNSDIYECVVSNMALQWSKDLRATLSFLQARSSNIFAFSTLLDGTFQEWDDLLSHYQPIKLLQYPNREEMLSLCAEITPSDWYLEYKLKDFPLNFENNIEFMRYLQSLGACGSNTIFTLSNFKRLIKEPHQVLNLSYKVFFGIFRKKNIPHSLGG